MLRRRRDLRDGFIEGAAAVAVAAFVKNAESYQRTPVKSGGNKSAAKMLQRPTETNYGEFSA